MKKLLLLLICVFPLLAQTSIQHGSGAPAAGLCDSARKYGRVYMDVTPNPPVIYSCGISGWGVLAPASPANSIQFNNAGAFGGMTGSSWTDATRILVLGQSMSSLDPFIQGWEDPANNSFIGYSGASNMTTVAVYAQGALNSTGVGIISLGGATGLANGLDATAITNADAGLVSAITERPRTLGIIAADTLVGINALSPALDAGSSAMNIYGLKVEDQSGAANNWAIRTGLGLLQWGDVEQSASVTFANLPGTPADGMHIYCSDCKNTTNLVGANTCANMGTGAFAVRINGAWKCYQ